MRRFADFIGSELSWVQPNAFKLEYELRSLEDVAATLRFKSSFRTTAVGDCGEGSWTFRRPGFWQTTTVVQDALTEAEIAVFKRNFWKGGGTLEFGFGRRLLARTNFWQTALTFQAEDGAPIVQYQLSGVMHSSAAVTIGLNAANLPELPWLVMLGWYLAVMMRRDSAAAAAA